MSMDFYMPRHEQQKLREKLDQLPGLVEDLAVTITGQARVMRPGLGRLKHQKPGSRLPFNLKAAAASNELDRCLAGWVHFICQRRQIKYTGPRNTLSHGNWLKRNISVLALLEGAEIAYDDIAGRILECQDIIDLPPDDEIHIDRARVKAANKSVVTLSTIDGIARRCGAVGLNRDRLRLLVKAGLVKVASVDKDTGTHFYRLGAVLDAHNKHTRRNRKVAGRQTPKAV